MNKTPSYKDIWQISYPIIMSLIAQNVINVIDTAFLGRVGEVALGASAIAGLFYISLFMLGFGFAIGSQILISRRNGEDRHTEIGRIVDQSFYFLVILALTLFLIVKFFSPFLIDKFISSPNVAEACNEFLRFRIWGIFFAFANVIFRAFYIGIAKTKVLTYSAVIMAIVNIIFAFLLVFGNLGFPKLGIGGAAIASVIAEACSAIFFILYTMKTTDLNKYNLFRMPLPDFKFLRKVLDISFPVMLQYFLSLGGWFVFFMIIEHINEHSLAISNIIRSAYLVLMIPLWGFSNAASTLISNSIGQGKKELLWPIIGKVTKITFVFSAVMVVISAIIPRTIISLYTSDLRLIEDTLPTLYVILIAMLCFSSTIIIFNAVTGTANTMTAFIIEAITIAVYLIATYIVAIVLKLPIELVWTVEFIYFIVLGSLSYLYLRTGKWQNKVV